MEIIGNKFLVDFGNGKIHTGGTNESPLMFTITELNGENMNDVETVAIKLTGLRPKLYLLTWKEKNGNTITQIHDHEKGLVYMNWTSPGGGFTNATGIIKPV